MTTMSKFLALIPVVAFAAGCNGMAPSGPSQVSSNDATLSASGDVSAMGTGRCAPSGIELTINSSEDTMVWVDATYRFATRDTAPRCAPPTWISDREGLTVDKTNPFRAGFFRLIGGVATLKVSGPNGVHNAIQLDLNTNTNPRHGAPGVCENVAKVLVTVVPGTDDAAVVLEASYVYEPPVSTPCPIAPVWIADRDGLRVSETSPFKASIDRSADATTTVIATAPNGAAGSTTF